MAKVLHIDGPGQVIDHFSAEPGESIRDVAKRLGVTIRAERIPDGPKTGRRLSREAAEFIRDYKPEEADSVLAIYWRYHSLDAEEFDTVEEARGFIETGEDYGSLAGEAVVDATGGVIPLTQGRAVDRLPKCQAGVGGVPPEQRLARSRIFGTQPSSLLSPLPRSWSL
jgi:hypothetical protein